MLKTSRLAVLALGLMVPACSSTDDTSSSAPGSGSGAAAGSAQAGSGGSGAKAGSGGSLPGGNGGSSAGKGGSGGSSGKAGGGAGSTAGGSGKGGSGGSGASGQGAGGTGAGATGGTGAGATGGTGAGATGGTGAGATGGTGAGATGGTGAGATGGSGGSETAGSAGSGISGGSGGNGGDGGTGGTGAGATAGTGGSGTAGGTASGFGNDGYFEAPEPWTKDVSALDKSSQSDAIIGWLDGNGGWGTGQMRIDFSIEVLEANASTPVLGFTPTDDFFKPDCDVCNFPIPPGGAIEGEQGYQCVSDGDCHLIVHDPSTKRLYEMWRANLYNGNFFGGCAAEWDLTKAYPDNVRGDGCTAADAGGFPIGAMLFSADEIAAGEINHAIRFILPNERIRHMVYVHPGTHSTMPTSGGADAPPYGVRFRLRKDFPLDSLPSDGARVIAKAMQRYGMLLADGGNIALTARSDRFTTHKWDEVGVDSFSLTGIQVTDMEVVDMGDPIELTGDCVRNP